MAKVYVDFFVGDDVNAVARRLRREGFEVHVHGKVWITVIAEGEYKSALNLVGRTVIAYFQNTFPIDWGKLETGQ